MESIKKQNETSRAKHIISKQKNSLDCQQIIDTAEKHI